MPIDFDKLKEKKSKAQLSITVDRDNLKYLKQDMKKEGVDVSLSKIFDMLLEDFVKTIKEERRKQQNKEDEEGNGDEKTTNN